MALLIFQSRRSHPADAGCPSKLVAVNQSRWPESLSPSCLACVVPFVPSSSSSSSSESEGGG